MLNVFRNGAFIGTTSVNYVCVCDRYLFTSGNTYNLQHYFNDETRTYDMYISIHEDSPKVELLPDWCPFGFHIVGGSDAVQT